MDGGRDAPYPWKREQPGRSPRTPARQVGKANQLKSTLPNLGQLGQVGSNLESNNQVVFNRGLTLKGGYIGINMIC